MRERKLLIVLFFIPPLLAAFFASIDFQMDAPAPTNDSESLEAVPVVIIDQAEVTQFALDGKKANQIQGRQLMSYNFTEQIKIDQPNVKVDNDDGAWVGTSHTGFFEQSKLSSE